METISHCLLVSMTFHEQVVGLMQPCDCPAITWATSSIVQVQWLHVYYKIFVTCRLDMYYIQVEFHCQTCQSKQW